jgi:hypothetical protein
MVKVLAVVNVAADPVILPEEVINPDGLVAL